MNEMTPSACREEAVRQGRLATEAYRVGDDKKAKKHVERARELTVLALKLEKNTSDAS